MSAIGSVSSLQNALLNRLQAPLETGKANGPGSGIGMQGLQGLSSDQTQQAGFGKLFEGMIASVDAKQKEAGELTKKVLMGQNDQLHQSVIAMQEASVSFSLMIEVRNKLVDSYQELMRMPV